MGERRGRGPKRGQEPRTKEQMERESGKDKRRKIRNSNNRRRGQSKNRY